MHLHIENRTIDLRNLGHIIKYDYNKNIIQFAS